MRLELSGKPISMLLLYGSTLVSNTTIITLLKNAIGGHEYKSDAQSEEVTLIRCPVGLFHLVFST